MHHNPRALLCSISNPLLTLTLNCQNTQKFKACPLCPLSACLSPNPHLWKYFRKHFVDFSSIQKCRLYASAAGRQMPPLRLALTCGFVFSVSAFCVGSSRRASLRLGLRLCFCFWLVSYIFSTLPLPPVVYWWVRFLPQFCYVFCVVPSSAQLSSAICPCALAGRISRFRMRHLS